MGWRPWVKGWLEKLIKENKVFLTSRTSKTSVLCINTLVLRGGGSIVVCIYKYPPPNYRSSNAPGCRSFFLILLIMSTFYNHFVLVSDYRFNKKASIICSGCLILLSTRVYDLERLKLPQINYIRRVI